MYCQTFTVLGYHCPFLFRFQIIYLISKYTFECKVCKSVHHRTILINHRPDAKIFQFIILTFIYSSTCFGRFPAYHQELNDCSDSLWFYLRIVVTVVLLFVVGPYDPITNTSRLSPRYEGKTRGCHCSH